MAGKIPSSWGSQHGQNRLVAERVNPILTQPILDLAKLTYVGNALKDVRVNAAADNVEFYDPTTLSSLTSPGAVKSSSPSAGVGYATGAGGMITQITGRTTGVTLNKVCGQITLVSAAGTVTWQTFTVTNSTVAATDTIHVNQASGTDLNMIHVTNVAAGSFKISFATTGGITTEQPVFNFAVLKSVTA